MALNTVASLTNTVVTRYEKEYKLIALNNPGVWAQFIDWQPPIAENGGGGSSFDFPVYGETDLVETTLEEDQDPASDSILDTNMTVTPGEWGKSFGSTKKLGYQARTNFPEVMGKSVSMNRINSIDRVLRRGACGYGATGPTRTYRINSKASMALLDPASSTDTVSWAWLQELQFRAAAMNIEPFNNGQYHVIVPPAFILDLQQLTEFRTVGYYQDKENIYGSIGKPFSLAGFLFIPSNMGRLHLGSGLPIQAATTLTANVARGATTVPVTEQTGLVAGNYVTIGTLESESVSPGANLEQVLITAAAGSSGAGNLTVRGNGVGENNGTRFAHASGESIIESANVVSLPIIGKNSMIGVYGSDTGKYGKEFADHGTLDKLHRMSYFSWYWYGGVGLVQKHILLGRCAVSTKQEGYN